MIYDEKRGWLTREDHEKLTAGEPSSPPLGMCDEHFDGLRDAVYFHTETSTCRNWKPEMRGCVNSTPPAAKMSDDQIKYMVNRFLTWRFPDNFNPDGGISFKRTFNEHTAYPMKHEPTGTNLLDAGQAEGMIRYLVEGMATGDGEDMKLETSKVKIDIGPEYVRAAIQSAVGGGMKLPSLAAEKHIAEFLSRVVWPVNPEPTPEANKSIPCGPFHANCNCD